MKILKILYLSLILCIAANYGFAQNLIPNFSFEAYDTCPYSAGQIYYSPPWTDPTNASTDYFNSCNGGGAGVPINFAGRENAKDGSAYAGLALYSEPFGTNYREYLQVQLTGSLNPDSCYRLIFYVSVTDQNKYSVNNFGAYFSALPVTTCFQCVMPYLPQIDHFNPSGIADTSGWYKIEETFMATGGEQYLTIGNFKYDTATTVNNINPGATGFALYYIDSLALTKVVCDTSIGVSENQRKKYFKLFPNPSNGNVSIRHDFKLESKADLKIFDVAGSLLKEIELNTPVSQTEITFDLNEGVYLYQIIVNNIVVQSDRLIIIK